MSPMNKYSNTELNSLSQTELEVRALVRMASALNSVKENFEEEKAGLDAILEKNKKLWLLFASNMGGENPIPVLLKNNILNIAQFVFNQTVDVMINPSPEKLEALININMEIAMGLKEGIGKKPDDNPVLPSEEESLNEEPLEEKKTEDEYDDIFG